MIKKNKIYTKWSKDGIYCHESKGDCSNCDIYTAYGFHKDNIGFKQCHMPDVVQYLLSREIPISESVKGYKGHYVKDSGL